MTSRIPFDSTLLTQGPCNSFTYELHRYPAVRHGTLVPGFTHKRITRMHTKMQHARTNRNSSEPKGKQQQVSIALLFHNAWIGPTGRAITRPPDPESLQKSSFPHVALNYRIFAIIKQGALSIANQLRVLCPTKINKRQIIPNALYTLLAAKFS